MAGDRGLAFVIIGLIGVSGLWVSNHRRAASGPSAAATIIVEQEQQIPGAGPLTKRSKTGISLVRDKTYQSRFLDTIDEASYVVRGHDPAVYDLRQEAILESYPKLRDPSPQSPGFAPPLN